MKVEAHQPFGASITDLNLASELSAECIEELTSLWLKHHVLNFPGQDLNHRDLERFTQYFGPFGDDPFFESIDDSPYLAAVERLPDESTPIFASTFHTDWSFMPVPPAGTILYGVTIPPVGGDTLFANQHLAYEHMPEQLRKKVDGLVAIHSAGSAYAPDGFYGDEDQQSGRSMRIRPHESANQTQTHPLVRIHPLTGKPALYSTAGYICGFQGIQADEAHELLLELYNHQTQDQFIYRQQWSQGMLTMWDNRCLLHAATGGYDGHHRYLLRSTIGDHAF